jgi:hypothetical protein
MIKTTPSLQHPHILGLIDSRSLLLVENWFEELKTKVKP